MCGISAVFSERKLPLADLVEKMNGLVMHRGPDGQGVLSLSTNSEGTLVRAEGGICQTSLGHTRLAIVDLSRHGSQPMYSYDRRYVITYNGEIYNHKQLRDELRRLGCVFVSGTDTEVVLAAFSVWGEKCLEHFNGMFSFVLVDCENRTVFAARDRFGVKPLYVYRSQDGLLAFASEIKQFTVLPGWNAQLNSQMAYDFLNWGVADHTSQTLFDGVTQLRGGQSIQFSLDHIPNNLPVKSWYSILAPEFEGGMGDAARNLKILLEDSVRLRLQADVPVGSCLSGGIDSSAIVCVASDLLAKAGVEGMQHTFSARSNVANYDEGRFISQVADKVGVCQHSVFPDLKDLFSVLPSLIWHQDEPFGSTSIYAQWHVFKLAKNSKIKVMLDGQGADELFGGYHGYFGSFLASMLKNLRLSELLHEMNCISSVHGYSFGYLFKLIANRALSSSLRQGLRSIVGKPSVGKVGWLNSKVLDVDYRDPYEVGDGPPQSLNETGMDHFTRTHLPMLLHWEDRNSMAHSIEARVPFLDYRLVEFAFSLQDNLKIRNGMTKAVLRDAMKGGLPEGVRGRVDKLGFATPEEIWLKSQAPEQFRLALRQAVEQSKGVITSSAISMLEEIIEGKRPFSFLPWRMISFGAWMETFSVSGP